MIILRESFMTDYFIAVLVETTSVVSHFSFGPQKNLIKTDILARYHNYANEMICPSSILEPESILSTDIIADS